MKRRDAYQYSRGRMGMPSALLALGWVALWALWPSFHEPQGGSAARRPAGIHVSYGTVQDSLYMSPLLFARATRVGFRAPETAAQDAELLDRDQRERRVRFLHVASSAPDFAGMKRAEEWGRQAKQVDAYRPVWKDTSVFDAVAMASGVVVRAGGRLQARHYRTGSLDDVMALALPKCVEVHACVEVDSDGVAHGAFLEKGSGNSALDGAVIRALESGRADGGAVATSDKVVVMIGSRDDSSN